MTEKEIIRKEIEGLKSNLFHGACASQVAVETRCKEEAYNEVLAIIDSMQEEPVGNDFEAEWERYCEAKGGGAITVNVKDLARHFAKWQREQDDKTVKDRIINAYNRGRKQMKKQMIDAAVDGTIGFVSIRLENPNFGEQYNVGDKVKVIIIKEE